MDTFSLAGICDEFGPNTGRPYAAIDLVDADSQYRNWLKVLPCPVIGVGDGPLSETCDVVLADETKLALIDKNIRAAPLAAMVLVQHLRASEMLSLRDALATESFAYATVQQGPEFQAWLSTYNRSSRRKDRGQSVLVKTGQRQLNIILNRPDTHNAISVEMRDSLREALYTALLDDSIEKVTLTGKGRTFSIGGAIEEFGKVPDPATAHWIRTFRLPAWQLVRLNDRLHVHVNGAAIGAGAEIAAFGKRITASENAWFQLPELKFGLIPGAGGTASLPRRIGRRRTAYMALSMDKIRAEKALEWELIDAIGEGI